MTYYVSPAGNDNWSGLLPEPLIIKHDGPFRTIERARDAVRLQRARKSRMPFKVLIRDGVHELQRPLVFTAADSGDTRHPVVYAAFPGEAPVLSGGKRIHGLRQGTVHGRKCWVADIPVVKKGQWTFTQLFVNGQRRRRPRLPKTGFYRFDGIPEASASAELGRGSDRAFFKKGHLRQWKNLEDVEVVVLQQWFDSHVKIRSVDSARRLVLFNRRTRGNLRDEVSLLARYFAVNVFEALKEPGEWYLDRHGGRLYYLPFPDEQMETAEVIAPRLQTLLQFAGRSSAPVRSIRFENVSLQHAEWSASDHDKESLQAATHVPGAVIFKQAEACALYGCSISKISQYGVEILEGCHNNQVVACTIFDMGAGGIKIGHEWMRRLDHTSFKRIPGRKNRKPSASVIADCSIHHGSLIYPSAIGIWIGNAGFNRLFYNHIHHLSYTGISCGWTWGYGPTATLGDLIEGNHVHHIAWDHILHDLGGIYTLGERPGCVVRRNHVHHVGGHGIYHDEGTTEQIVEQNLVHHASEAAFMTHYGKDNVVRNNIFALSGDMHFVPSMRRENHRSTTFERNIVYWKRGSLGSGTNIVWPTHCYKIRNNLLWAGGRTVDFGHGSNLEDWLKEGQFTGTLIADPLLHDPEDGQFALRSNSPAYRVGFDPFHFKDVGPRFTAERPDSLEAWQAKFSLPPMHPILRTRLELGRRNLVHLTLANVGKLAVTGKLQVVASPMGTARLSGKSTYSFKDLKPGRSLTAKFAITIKDRTKPFYIETIPSGDGLVPTLLHVKQEKVWPIHRFPSPQCSIMNQGNAMEIKYLGKAVAQFRMAMGDKMLLLCGDIEDRRIRQAKVPWLGSCIEFFAAPQRAYSADALTQMFLVPSQNVRSLKVWYNRCGAIVPAPHIETSCLPTPCGYRFEAHIPLHLLHLHARAQTFFVEFVVSAALSLRSATHGRLALFEAGSAFRSSWGYGSVRVIDASSMEM